MTGQAFTYIPHEPLEFVRTEASQLGLSLPSIELAGRLVTRLSRHNRTLDINDVHLLGGITELELENKLGITIDSLPKDDKKESPTLSYGPDIVQGTAQIYLRIDADLQKPDAQRHINTALWLGLLVGERLAEGQIADRKELKDRYMENGWKTRVPLGIIAGAAPGPMNIAMDSLNPSVWETIGSGMTLSLAAQALHALYAYGKIRRQSSPRHAEKKQRYTAKELARAYPVLDYGFTI